MFTLYNIYTIYLHHTCTIFEGHSAHYRLHASHEQQTHLLYLFKGMSLRVEQYTYRPTESDLEKWYLYTSYIVHSVAYDYIYLPLHKYIRNRYHDRN